MKIGYITVGEDLNSPLLRRQVVELLIKIKSSSPDVEIRLFNFQGMLSILNHRADLLKLSEELRAKGVSHWVIPNICPWPFPNIKLAKTVVGWRPYSVWNSRATRFFGLAALPWMMLFVKLLGFKALHCRSYVATHAAITYKKLFGGVKVLFDPRSDFPEEGVTAGLWGEQDENFLFWKEAEKKLLTSSDAVALIGPTYLAHYSKSVGRFRYFYAPNNVDCNFFDRRIDARENLRSQLDIDYSTLVFSYLGALTKEGWHQPEHYLKFHQILSALGLKFVMIFLVPRHCKLLVETIFYGIENVRIVCPEYCEVSDYLSAADYGMMFFHRKKIAVATKIGEYLCSDLPVIINDNCIGAAEYLERNPSSGMIVGLNLGDLDVSIDVDADKVSALRGAATRTNAAKYFGIDRIADQYLDQYENL